MTTSLRKKSPRAPSIPLHESLDKAMKIYDRETKHPASTDIIAQHLGYKSANNGKVLSILASLGYFGLLERPKEGMLAVSKEVEAYKFAPDAKLQRTCLLAFLRQPTLYAELLDQYQSGLPSDANLKFELIQRGFAPQAAESALHIFKESVSFADYYHEEYVDEADENVDDEQHSYPSTNDAQTAGGNENFNSSIYPNFKAANLEAELDRIPVRLSGGRKAWLLIPTPFYNADKLRLKAQIDLLLTLEDEAS